MARTSETTSAKDDTKKRGKRNADGTKKPGRLKQMFEVFKYTQEVDRSTLPLMIADAWRWHQTGHYSA